MLGHGDDDGRHKVQLRDTKLLDVFQHPVDLVLRHDVRGHPSRDGDGAKIAQCQTVVKWNGAQPPRVLGRQLFRAEAGIKAHHELCLNAVCEDTMMGRLCCFGKTSSSVNRSVSIIRDMGIAYATNPEVIIV